MTNGDAPVPSSHSLGFFVFRLLEYEAGVAGRWQLLPLPGEGRSAEAVFLVRALGAAPEI